MFNDIGRVKNIDKKNIITYNLDIYILKNVSGVMLELIILYMFRKDSSPHCEHCQRKGDVLTRIYPSLTIQLNIYLFI